MHIIFDYELAECSEVQSASFYNNNVQPARTLTWAISALPSNKYPVATAYETMPASSYPGYTCSDTGGSGAGAFFGSGMQ
jgi:hypothetical protein